MPKVLIVVEESGEGVADSPTTARMVSALQQAITTSAGPPVTVQVVASNTLEHTGSVDLESDLSKDILLCPLTLNLPDSLPFQAMVVYEACRDVPGLRLRLAQQLKIAIAPTRDFAICDQCFWLPVVLTAKGPLYGEVIGLAGEAVGKKIPNDLSLCDLSYYQPFHLSDSRRQRLYQVAHSLMQLLSAPPATYLVQFAFQDSDICFDRLWPFPAAPAIASLGVQEPNLFTCHWYCLTGLPVLDLLIPPLADQALS